MRRPPRHPEQPATQRRSSKPWRCRIGWHGTPGESNPGDPVDHLIWCEDCGTTWRSVYDGIEAGWRRERDMSFGRPR